MGILRLLIVGAYHIPLRIDDNLGGVVIGTSVFYIFRFLGVGYKKF
jgi:hypothetical protein